MSTHRRIEKVQQHLSGEKVETDVVIVAATRTAITRAKRGGFKDTTPDTMLQSVFEELIKKTNIQTELIGDISIGNVLQPGSAVVASRFGQLLAGIPYTVPIHSVNRQCSSGLQAFANVAAGIKAGYYDIGIAGGVESMSLSDMASSAPDVCWEKIYDNEVARNCTISMGLTSENVATTFNVSRQKQDAFAAHSHQKAAQALKKGLFINEITPVHTVVTDNEGNEKKVTIDKDEGIREDTNVERLSKLKAAFKENGTTTAGNSSQVSDGAAAVLVMSRARAKQLKLPILGRFVSYAVAGVPPEIMGIGPAKAIPLALERANLSLDNIDVFELNEAFASQAIYCIENLNIPIEKVNPKGGAIALGHPLGCTGARQIVTLLYTLKEMKKKYGIVSMCIGTGMGAAAIFENEML